MKHDTADLSFTDIWNPPFHSIDLSPLDIKSIHVLNSENQICFNFCSFKFKELQDDVINSLNGEPISDEFKNILIGADIHHDGTNVYIGDTKLLLVRGWGHLTGLHSIHFSDKKAYQCQQELLDYAVNQLKNSQNS